MNNDEYADSVTWYMKKLTIEGVDTIIRLNLFSNHRVDGPKVSSITAANTSYLFYVRNDSSHFVRYDWHKYSDGTISSTFSTPEWIEKDTLFRWLSQNIEVVTNWLVPFIYKINSDSLPQFRIWEPLEYNVYYIEWYYAGTRRFSRLAPHWFEKSNLHNYENLNHKYNTSTKTFQLFKQLELLTIKLDPWPRRL